MLALGQISRWTPALGREGNGGKASRGVSSNFFAARGRGGQDERGTMEGIVRPEWKFGFLRAAVLSANFFEE